MITKIIAEEKIQSVKKKIEESAEIVIVTHLSPDGDAVGSSLALAHFLKFLEKKVTIVVPNAYPDNLKWMPGAGQIINHQEKQAFAEGVIAGADLLFALDFNMLPRIGNMAAAVDDSPAYKILVDHHPDPGNFADLIVSYPQIASTAEMVFRLICRMGYFTDISEECATCIYT
jgi:phosphoesterase RecJ-like protein